MMCLSQQPGKPENLLRGRSGERKGKEPKRKYQVQNEIPQFPGRCNYLVTEDIKRGNPFDKKINVLNNVKSSHNFKSRYNGRVQNSDHL